MNYIDPAPLKKCVKAPRRRFLLSAGDQRIDSISQLSVPVVVLRGKEFFNKEGAEWFQAAHQADRLTGSAVHVPACIDQ